MSNGLGRASARCPCDAAAHRHASGWLLLAMQASPNCQCGSHRLAGLQWPGPITCNSCYMLPVMLHVAAMNHCKKGKEQEHRPRCSARPNRHAESIRMRTGTGACWTHALQDVTRLAERQGANTAYICIYSGDKHALIVIADCRAVGGTPVLPAAATVTRIRR